jgi:pimeloyl-ACP methyl ester carboxylesterase
MSTAVYTEALGERMPSVRAAGTTFSYRQVGDTGDALIFMHGYLGSAGIWDEALPALGEHHRCFAIDARGVGDSARAADGYTVDQWAEDVLAVADALEIEHFGYVAHSMGGLTAHRLALSHPDRLDALVLVCPSPSGPPRAGRAAFAAFRNAWAAEDAVAMAALFAATSVHLPDPEKTAVRGRVAVTAAEGHVDALLDAAAEVDFRGRLAQVRTPTMLVLGAADPALKAGLEDFALLADATLQVMSGVGHVPQLERSAEFVEVVEGFLRDGVVTFSTLMSRLRASPGSALPAR